MKKNILTLFLISFGFGQMSLFAMNFKPIILVRITDITVPRIFKYTLQVPCYEENKRTYVLFDDLWNAMNKQHNSNNARLFNFMYVPDGKKGFVDYDKKKIFLDLNSLDDIFVIPFNEDI